MKLYHPDASEPVICHPSRVDQMKANGWTEEKKKVAQVKSESNNVKKQRG